MRKRATLAATVVTVAAAMVGVTSAADAATIVENYCELQPARNAHLVLNATAYYVDDVTPEPNVTYLRIPPNPGVHSC